MSVPQTVLDLIQRFEDNQQSYRTAQFNEAQAREELINPFFEALGWDMRNTQGYSEKYKEVIHEDALKIRGATKAPDYAFRVGGRRVFFVEAKKPSVNVKEDVYPAYQLRRYAWSAKLPLSILTDFEEFAVYDCRIKPVKTDKAATARIMYLTYHDYVAHWDELVARFSPEAIHKGALDRYVETTKVKKGTAEVDAAFLAEIENWRQLLARNIALRNPGLKVRELNHAVQMTIDRFIFLRICEDRGIEPYGRLRDTVNQGPSIYPRLVTLFRQADDRYNSGLFHFKPEKDNDDPPDTFTPALTLDDKVLKDIVKNLYYPDSPYEFSALPADILGQVYEQFLGKVIRLTAGGQAKVEEKPEVKKAGGVYYTPTYIVDYIVEHTVGELLKDKTWRQAKGLDARNVQRYAPLRILDPACGSGTFLLQAYQYLLDWYLDQYTADNPQTHVNQGRLMPSPSGAEDWQLTAEERKRILLTHIHGVDIDPQAVEVTKLSLLLKVLEGEAQAALGTQMSFDQARVLPDLGHNIRCGNSLIGSDYYQRDQMAMPFLNEEEMYRINAFDWDSPQGFGRAMAAGGFDAVIGNPPYIRIQAMKEYAPQEVEFYKQQYTAASKGNYDIYVVFAEKGLSLLRPEGRLGYILPHKFFNAKYGEPLRGLIAQGKHLADVVHFGDQQIFANATTYTCLLFLDKAGRDAFHVAKVDDLAAWRNGGIATEGEMQAAVVGEREWNFVVGTFASIWEKLNRMPTRLCDVADRVFQGLITGADTAFILEIQDDGSYFSKATGTNHGLERELLHPLCKGSVNVRRYNVTSLDKAILFPYQIIQDKAILLTPQELSKCYPNIWEYLRQNRDLLEAREHGKWKHDKWYAFGRSQNLAEMEQLKIMTPSIASSASFTLDKTDFYYFVGSGGGGGGGYGITLCPNVQMAYEYILGLLNSRLLDTFLKVFSTPFRGGYYAFNRQYIDPLPIRTIDFDDPADVARHDQMVALVERMLALHRQLAEAKTPRAKRLLQQQIDVTDRAIDQLVYTLYGLTDEEIAIVEGAG